MRFVEFLRTSVLLFAGGATALAIAAIVGASGGADPFLLAVSVSWWIVAALVGLWLGRRPETSDGIRRLMTNARSSPSLPELEPPGRVVVNRMWPLALFLALCGGVAFLIPQLPAIGAGYAEIMALAWRKQARAVAAIEDRDGVRFYVERGPAFKPTQLVRTPWMRRIEPADERLGAA